jgi:alkylhydroperoxidase family enzyme
MPRVEVPDGPELTNQRALAALRPEFLGPWAACARAAHTESILAWRVKEAARYRLAEINGCATCSTGRWERGDDEGTDDAFYAAVSSYRSSVLFSEQEKLAIEFAERFALDHIALAVDDGFFDRLHGAFSDAEILDLAFCCARNMGFGRFTHVMGFDDQCGFSGDDVLAGIAALE